MFTNSSWIVRFSFSEWTVENVKVFKAVMHVCMWVRTLMHTLEPVLKRLHHNYNHDFQLTGTAMFGLGVKFHKTTQRKIL